MVENILWSSGDEIPKTNSFQWGDEYWVPLYPKVRALTCWVCSHKLVVTHSFKQMKSCHSSVIVFLPSFAVSYPPVSLYHSSIHDSSSRSCSGHTSSPSCSLPISLCHTCLVKLQLPNQLQPLFLKHTNTWQWQQEHTQTSWLVSPLQLTPHPPQEQLECRVSSQSPKFFTLLTQLLSVHIKVLVSPIPGGKALTWLPTSR